MALKDTERALQDAREIGRAAELIYTVVHIAFPLIFSGRHETADKLLDEVIALAQERSADYLKLLATMFSGCLFAVTGRAPESIQARNRNSAIKGRINTMGAIVPVIPRHCVCGNETS